MRLLIAEDSVILRDGLVALLTRRGHEVVGAAGDGEQLRALLADLEPERAPDVVIIDIRMPPTFTDEGLHAALAIRSADPQQGVLLFSQYVETRFAAQLLTGDARGVGYLLKDRVADVSDFIDALERIADGHTVLDPEVVTQLMGAARADDGLTRLTPRENEVLEPHGPGTVQHRDRRASGALLRCCREERLVDLHQARPPARRRRPPSCPRRAAPPQRLRGGPHHGHPQCRGWENPTPVGGSASARVGGLSHGPCDLRRQDSKSTVPQLSRSSTCPAPPPPRRPPRCA